MQFIRLCRYQIGFSGQLLNKTSPVKCGYLSLIFDFGDMLKLFRLSSTKDKFNASLSGDRPEVSRMRISGHMSCWSWRWPYRIYWRIKASNIVHVWRKPKALEPVLYTCTSCQTSVRPEVDHDSDTSVLFKIYTDVQCEWKNPHPSEVGLPDIFHFFTNGWEFLIAFYTPIIRSYIHWMTNLYSIISNFDEVMPYSARLYPVHIICSKCPSSAETHAFRRLRTLLIALLIVVCGKSLKNNNFINVIKHVGYGMTSPMTSFAE